MNGGCQCGAVRYRIDGTPGPLYACHCTECRKQSASAFGLSLVVRRRDLTLTAGSPRTWTRPTDGGGTLDCRFCPTCGTRVWHEDGPEAEALSLKAGSLDQPPDLSAAIHIWTRSACPGVVIPDDASRFAGEPDEEG